MVDLKMDFWCDSLMQYSQLPEGGKKNEKELTKSDNTAEAITWGTVIRKYF